MFHVRIFDPIESKMQPVHTISESDEDSATELARNFLLSQGVRLGDMIREGDSRAKAVFGFEDQPSVSVENGGYGCVTNSIYFTFKYIRETLDLRVDSFIDLGCGPGNILISAHNLLGAQRLTGIEIDHNLVEQARTNTAELNAEIVEADLLTWLPEKNDFDMVYMYEPFRDETARQRFLDHLGSWLRDGQYIFYQHVQGGLPQWLGRIEIPNISRTCLFTFDKNKI